MIQIKIFLNSNSKEKKKAIDETLNDLLKKIPKVRFRTFSKYIKIDISETPINELTPKGAELRAEKLKEIINDNFSIFIGIESGLVKRYNHWFEECWTCLIYKNKKYFAYSSGLLLPSTVFKKMSTQSHVAIMSQLEKETQISSKNTWGIYTKGILQRRISFSESIRNVFTSFLIDNHLFK